MRNKRTAQLLFEGAKETLEERWASIIRGGEYKDTAKNLKWHIWGAVLFMCVVYGGTVYVLFY